MFGPTLLKTKNDFSLHQQITKMIEKLDENAFQLRALESELFLLGTVIYDHLNDFSKRMTSIQIEKLDQNYKKYKDQLIKYVKERNDIITQIPGLIIYMKKDLFEAGQLREEDHITIIDELYQWLKSTLPSIMEKCIPISNKDRSGKSLFDTAKSPDVSVFPRDLKSIQADKGLDSASWLQSTTGLKKHNILSESKAANAPIPFEHQMKTNVKLIEEFSSSIERLTTHYQYLLYNGLL